MFLASDKGHTEYLVVDTNTIKYQRTELVAVAACYNGHAEALCFVLVIRDIQNIFLWIQVL